jgi:hypothetical protein
MKASTITTFLSSFALASAVTVQINATTSGIDRPNGGYKILTNDIASINSYDGLALTKLQLVQDQTVSAASIECRAYKDAAGTQPGSAAFTGSETAVVSTNTVTIGGILCYAVKAL